MELLVGCELGEMVTKEGRLDGRTTCDFLTQTARALDSAHEKGVVHRDLKPENLFVVQRKGDPPTIKILDFGIAKIVAGVSKHSTMPGGTPLYMAPEQTSRSSKVGPTTDIWALGLIAFTLLVGTPYWEAEDLNQLYGEILGGDYEAPTARARRRGVALSAGFDGWFFRCVNRDPGSRFQRATDAIAARTRSAATCHGDCTFRTNGARDSNGRPHDADGRDDELAHRERSTTRPQASAAEELRAHRGAGGVAVRRGHRVLRNASVTEAGTDTRAGSMA